MAPSSLSLKSPFFGKKNPKKVQDFAKNTPAIHKRGNATKALGYQTVRLGKITMHNFSYFINKDLIFIFSYQTK